MDGSGEAGRNELERRSPDRRGSRGSVRADLKIGALFPRYSSRTTFWFTTVIRIASLGHACTHAGASPWARRCEHMSHLRTMPRRSEYCGTSYGHISTQYWQPMH